MKDAITVDELRAQTEGWRPPPELGIPTPRPVTFTIGGWFALVSVSAVLVAIAVGLVVMWQNLTRTRDHRAALLRNGVETEARVLHSRATGGKSRSYFLTYAFTVGPRSYVREAKVTSKFYQTHPPLIRVRYAEANPHDNVLVVGARVNQPFLAVLLLIPTAMLLVVPGVVIRDRTLLRNGLVFPALVRGHSTHKSRTFVDYSFVNGHGRVAKGWHSVPGDRIPAVGTVIPVLTGPARGASSAPYPLSFARLRQVQQ